MVRPLTGCLHMLQCRCTKLRGQMLSADTCEQPLGAISSSTFSQPVSDLCRCASVPEPMLRLRAGPGTYIFGAAIGRRQQQHRKHWAQAVLPRGSLQETHGFRGQAMAGRPPACLGSEFQSLLLLQSVLLLSLLAGVHGLPRLGLGGGAEWARPVPSRHLGWRRGLAVPGGRGWADCMPLRCSGGRRVCLALRGSR